MLEKSRPVRTILFVLILIPQHSDTNIKIKKNFMLIAKSLLM